jgi:hypothetical protein
MSSTAESEELITAATAGCVRTPVAGWKVAAAISARRTSSNVFRISSTPLGPAISLRADGRCVACCCRTDCGCIICAYEGGSAGGAPDAPKKAPVVAEGV